MDSRRTPHPHSLAHAPSPGRQLLKPFHWTLVTLLLANSLAMEALPVVLSVVLSPRAAVVVSVTAVLLVGEILPQAVCSRFGLGLGARFAWLVGIPAGAEPLREG